MAEFKPKTRSDLTLVEIDGEALVYDPRTEGIHHLNPMASIVYQLTDGKATVSETACGIAEAFGARVEDVERDVKSAVREFRNLQLLEGKDDAESSRTRSSRGRTKREQIRLESQPSP
jgi:hypothetical protein